MNAVPATNVQIGEDGQVLQVHCSDELDAVVANIAGERQ